MKSKIGLSLVALVVLSSTLAISADESKLEGVMCLLQGKKAANVEKASKYKDGKVYFCCDGCLGKFDKMTKEEKTKIAAKANSQLVASKQYTQEACPFTGGKLNDEMKLSVNGAEVKFCCGNCKGKAEKMADEDKLEKVFGDAAFEKGKFKVAKK